MRHGPDDKDRIASLRRSPFTMALLLPLLLITLGGVAPVAAALSTEAIYAEGRQQADATLQPAGQDCRYTSIRPKQYIAYKTSNLSPDNLDGDLTKNAWAEVPWTDEFVDISTSTAPRLRTRAKLRWDDSFLYVAAELQEPQLWATLTRDDTVIFNDNDFEVFVDPGATTHFYKEFEMNAFNKSWDLVLNAPYADGGYENSSRVFHQAGFQMRPPLRSAVKLHPEGLINDPARTTEAWTVEIALPLEELRINSTAEMPTHGSVWRINFSRVQWHLVEDPATGGFKKAPACQSCPQPGTAHEDNWVWSPQGEIQMHLPERWGLLQFSSEAVGSTTPAEYAEWRSRSAAMAVYYAQKNYKAHSNKYADSLEALLPYSTPPFELCQSAETDIKLEGSDFVASVNAGGGYAATVRGNRFLTVEQVPQK